MEVVALLTPKALFLLCLCLLAAGLARLVLLLKGAREARRQRDCGTDDTWSVLLRSDLVPAVAVIAVPPDASPASFLFVRRLLNLHAGNPEIVLVLDGPADTEMAAWKKEFHLEPSSRLVNALVASRPVKSVYASTEPIRLVVLEKERGGYTDCLNAGLNVGNAPVIATVDADAQFAEEALLRLLRPMLEDPDRTIAVCAVAPVAPAKGLFAQFYRLEFLRTWLGRCAGLATSNTFLPAPGCFALMRRDAVVEARGFHAGPLEMAIRLHARARALQRPYRIVFISEPMSSPPAPQSGGAVVAAIEREQREVGAALRFHRALVLGFGSLGWVAIPGLLGSRFLLPLVETALLVLGAAAAAKGWVLPETLGLLVAAPLVFEMLMSMTAVLLEQFAAGANAEPGQVASLFFSAIPENLGYRQWRNLRMMSGLLRGYQAASGGAK